MYEFDQWLASKGFDPTALSAEQKTTLQASWRAEANPQPAPVPAPTPATANPPPPPTTEESFEAVMADARAEANRRSAITRLVKQALSDNPDPKALETIEKVGQKAIDGNWNTQQTELALLRAGRGTGPGPAFYVPTAPVMTAEVIEAAMCVAGGLKEVDKKYSDQVLQAAHTRFRRGIGLNEAMLLCAESTTGQRLRSSDRQAVARAAFSSRQHRNDGYELMASASGVSTISAPVIFSNVANKFLEQGWFYGEQTCLRIARISSGTDFKPMTRVRMTGATKFKPLGPGGEIKSGTLGELTYTNQIKSYALGLDISYEQQLNDDLAALSDAPMHLGRGAIDNLNDVFWAEFKNDSTFFYAGNNNFDSGADSALDLDGLANADNIFASQTKPDGTPLGVEPKILLVARPNKSVAINLMNSQFLNGVSGSLSPSSNYWQGQFQVEASVYLNSAPAAWYLLADANDTPVIEIAFLNGVQVPTIEQTDMDFDTYGIRLRGAHRFGVAKVEPRGGVKMAGS